MTRNTNEPTVPEDHATFEHPIIGQEAICPHGLGRVTTFRDHYPEQRWIEVTTHTDNYTCRWDPANVTLVPIPGVSDASLVRQVSELKKENALLNRVVASLEAEADWLSAHATELHELRNAFKRMVEHLSKGQCLGCVDAECDDCDGTNSDDDDDEEKKAQWDLETYRQELEATRKALSDAQANNRSLFAQKNAMRKEIDELREANNRMKLAANKSWLEKQTDKGTVYPRLTRVLDELFPEALRCQPTTDHALDVFDRHGLSLAPTENQS